MNRQLDEGRVIDGLGRVRNLQRASLGVFGQYEQFRVAGVQRFERRGAWLQRINRVASQQQRIVSTQRAQATGQAFPNGE